MPTTRLGLPYPTPSNANNPPYDFQKLAEAVDTQLGEAATNAIAALENKILVGGKLYQKSGEQTGAVTSFTSLANGAINYATIEVPFPFYPPTGYRFVYEMAESGSTLSFVITSSQTVSKRITKLYFIQFGSQATGAKRLVWRLEKIS